MIRVVSWNIEHGLNIAQAATDLTTIPALGDPDIVLLQEMSGTGTENLAAQLGLDYRYFAPANHPETGLPFGNAILSPWPMEETEYCELPHTARIQGQPRSVTWTIVVVDVMPVATFSVHIETVLLGLRRRAKQVDTLRSSTVGHDTVVIGGDFNTASRRSTRCFDAVLSTAGLHRYSNSDATFHRFGRPFRLDHLYGKGLVRVGSGVAAGATASDHLPIWATFERR